jgi:hypothetical protein
LLAGWLDTKGKSVAVVLSGGNAELGRFLSAGSALPQAIAPAEGQKTNPAGA